MITCDINLTAFEVTFEANQTFCSISSIEPLDKISPHTF